MTLLTAFEELVQNLRPCFQQERTFERARALAYASVLTFGRHTVTRLICSKNEQHRDWSADYRLFSQRQWSAHDLFFEILKHGEPHSHWPNGALVSALDDTTRQKTGKRIPGVCTLRDPMSLPYHVNLIPGIRFLQASLILKPEDRIEYSRALPILFEEAAPAKKPKKNAGAEEHEHYREQQKVKRLSVQGLQAALHLRQQVDWLPHGQERMLIVLVDGSFCNKYFLRGLPENVIAIARTRKDVKLFKPPAAGMRRNRRYGERLPTPEEIRRDDHTYPWTEVEVFYAGRIQSVRCKELKPVLWRSGTQTKSCRLIVIAALGYRLRKGAKKLYHEPAYLLTTDLDTPLAQVVQYYLSRWNIEVNHRDEKSLLGVGDAQVRAPLSVPRNPQFAVAVYSLLLLAGLRAYGASRTADYLPLPKWRKDEDRRPSTLDLVSQFRREVMLAQLPENVKPTDGTACDSIIMQPQEETSGFANTAPQLRSPRILPVSFIAAALYADS